MTVVYHRSRGGLDAIEEDVSPEGMAILLAQPPRLARGVVVIVSALLITAIAWSFFGRADVIVSAQGVVAPEQDQVQVFLPVPGELRELFVAEGQLVQAGDTLARVNAPEAIRISGQAAAARLTLASAERQRAAWPDKRDALLAKVALLDEQIRAGQRDYDDALQEGMSKVEEGQRLKLTRVRNAYARAVANRDRAQRIMEQFQRLIASEGGGGVSEQQVKDREKDYQDAVFDVKLAEAELGEFELQLGDEYARRTQSLQDKFEKLTALKNAKQDQLIEIEEEEQRIDAELSRARSEAMIAERIKFEDLDANNFVRIRAPQDGVVTQISQTQPGAQLDAGEPLLSLAPAGARKVLEIRIDESNRAFLELGMPVKIKVNAFPYQRYGQLEGSLEYIAPAAFFDRDAQQYLYKARVGLNRADFLVNDTIRPIRYGMSAQAEVVVRQRRILDVALDPIRNILPG